MGRKFKTREEVKQLIVEYIETFYNYRRLHSLLGNISPIEYINKFSKQETAA